MKRAVDYPIQQGSIRVGARELKQLFEQEDDFTIENWRHLDRVLNRMGRVAHKMVKQVEDFQKGIPSKVYLRQH